MKNWYTDTKHPGVLRLCAMFNVHMNEFFRAADGYRNYESRPTAKKHIHKHRPAGSKLLKKHNRFEWDKSRNREAV